MKGKEMPKKVYIAGPMRGIEYYNFRAFDSMENHLKVEGFTVFNPAQMDRDVGFNPYTMIWAEDFDWMSVPDFDFRACTARDIAAIQQVDMICMLDGSEKALAEWLGLEVIYQTPPTDEKRVTDPDTGAQKGTKLARYDLIPWKPLWLLAEHYGRGAQKYAERNYEAGYKWSLSYAALQRHLNQFWAGEDTDPETGSLHLVSAAWHCFALILFFFTHPEKDDRVKGKM